MQEKQLYKYAVIRFVPRVEREEFINIGLIMFSKRTRFLKTKFTLNEEKLRLFPSELEIKYLRCQLASFEKICGDKKEGGYISTLEQSEQFGWLAATRSASIQTSLIRMGFSANLNETFERLYEELVL
jgi:Protein of unknown function (DUF3037).